MRIVDGPDEVHLLQVGRREVKAKTRAAEHDSNRTSKEEGKILRRGSKSERQSATLMGAEKDGSANSASTLSDGSAKNATPLPNNNNDDGMYDVNLKIEAQRRKTIELAKKYRYNNNNIDLSRDELDVEAFKSKEMEMKRRSRSIDEHRMGGGKAKL